MTDPAPTGSTLGAKLFVGFLVIATAALSLEVVSLTRQNRMLRKTVEKFETTVKSQGLAPGDFVGDIQLTDADSNPFILDFAPDKPPTLFLLTSAGCEGCEMTIPVWEGVLTEVQPKGLRIVNVEAGIAEPAELKAAAHPMWTSYIAPLGHEGWIRQVPVAPSALILSPNGAVLQRWYGPMTTQQATQMTAALIDLTGQ